MRTLGQLWIDLVQGFLNWFRYPYEWRNDGLTLLSPIVVIRPRGMLALPAGAPSDATLALPAWPETWKPIGRAPVWSPSTRHGPVIHGPVTIEFGEPVEHLGADEEWAETLTDADLREGRDLPTELKAALITNTGEWPFVYTDETPPPKAMPRPAPLIVDELGEWDPSMAVQVAPILFAETAMHALGSGAIRALPESETKAIVREALDRAMERVLAGSPA